MVSFTNFYFSRTLNGNSYFLKQMANMGYEEQMPAQTPAGAMSERAHSPWQGDYDFPPSVGPVSACTTYLVVILDKINFRLRSSRWTRLMSSSRRGF